MTDFFKAAPLDDVPEGGTYAIEVDGEPICLAKVEGTIYAFTDNCTHISGPLSDGSLEGCAITCPWHLAQFDIRTGNVLRGPARQSILTYPVKIEEQTIFIGLPDPD
jgi:nitrite reductase/ring-hydroxylating ferredoxin subunit